MQVSVAIQQDDVQSVRSLLARQSNRKAAADASQSLIHKACDIGNAGIIELLLDHSASVNRVDEANQSPLWITAARGHAAASDLLIDRSASVDNEPLPLSPSSTSATSVAATASNDRGLPLCAAAICNSIKIVRRLLTANAQVNAHDSSLGNATALHCAVQAQNEDLVQLLLAHKAIATLSNQQGESALQLAHEYRSESIVACLQQSLDWPSGSGDEQQAIARYSRDPMRIPCRILWLPPRSEIRVQRQNLRELPDELMSMTENGVESLVLRGNRIGSLSSLPSLLNLQVLDLSENALRTLPVEVGYCCSLRTLILDANQLTEVPRCLASLNALRVLSLAFNALQSIAGSTLAGMRSLVHLALNNNQLQQLPDEIRALHCMHQLNVGHNQLTHLPEELEHCTQLRKIVANNNQLQSVPRTLARLSNLHTLLLHCNPLDSAVQQEYDRGTQSFLSYLDAARTSNVYSFAGDTLSQRSFTSLDDVTARSVDDTDTSEEDLSEPCTPRSSTAATTLAATLPSITLDDTLDDNKPLVDLSVSAPSISSDLAVSTASSSSSSSSSSASTTSCVPVVISAEKLEHMKQKRTNIAKEILETERGYVQSLTKLVEVCRIAAKRHHKPIADSCVNCRVVAIGLHVADGERSSQAERHACDQRECQDHLW
jgi:hypothetical protein